VKDFRLSMLDKAEALAGELGVEWDGSDYVRMTLLGWGNFPEDDYDIFSQAWAFVSDRIIAVSALESLEESRRKLQEQTSVSEIRREYRDAGSRITVDEAWAVYRASGPAQEMDARVRRLAALRGMCYSLREMLSTRKDFQIESWRNRRVEERGAGR